MSTDTPKQLRQGKVQRGVRSTIRHLILIALSVVWLVPIVWLVVTSFSGYRGINFTTFFPETYTLDNYINVLFHPDSVAQFPQWFANTFIVAVFNCVISTCFVLMVAYAFSCCRFKSRRLLQNLSVTVNLFPGVLAMIAVYFVLPASAPTGPWPSGCTTCCPARWSTTTSRCSARAACWYPSPFRSSLSSCRNSTSKASPPAPTRADRQDNTHQEGLQQSFPAVMLKRTKPAKLRGM